MKNQKNSERQTDFNKSIMIVDADRDIVMGIEAMLQNKLNNIPIHKAHDGKTALEIFKKEKPCLIILDIMLPDQDGFHVIKMIGEKYPLGVGRLPQIIAITADPNDKKAIPGEKLGIRAYFFKPFKTETLIHEVEDALNEIWPS